MAAVTTKSTIITNRDAVPAVPNSSLIDGGFVREAVAKIAVASGDSTGSKYLLCSVPSGARVSQILVSSPDIGTTTTADIGLYRSTADGSAVVDADFFASALSLKDGAITESAAAHEAAVFTLANSEKALWEALGLSSDPKVKYDVVATLTGDADAAGTFKAIVRYVL